MRFLVLCGGGSRGAIEVGFAQALWEYGVHFDGIVGSSVGALNGAFLAAGRHPHELAAIWRQLRFRDVFAFNWRVLVRGTKAAALFTLGRKLRRLIRDLGVRRLEELEIPFVVVATDLATGEAVAIDQGLLVPALAASIAIPGLLAPVNLGGRCLVDGSLSANLPLAEAVRRGATEVWAMSCACCAVPQRQFNRLPDILAQVFGFAVDRGGQQQAEGLQGVSVHIWALDEGAHVAALDFRRSDELISRAYRYTQDRLPALVARPS